MFQLQAHHSNKVKSLQALSLLWVFVLLYSRVWKGMFGIWDFTGIWSGIQGNVQYLGKTQDLNGPLGVGFTKN